MNAGAGLATILMAAAGAAQASPPCDTIAAFARRSPPKAWASGDKALTPALVFDRGQSTSERGTPAFEVALAKRPDVEKALNVSEWGDLTIFADRLGADLYELSAYAGSASCRSQVFVEARPGSSPHIIQRAPWPDDPQHMLCQGYRSDAGFAHAFGRGVWVAHDVITGEAKSASLTIYPRTTNGWARGCKLDLTFRADYAVSRRWCHDAAVCAAAERIAKDVVVKYRAQRDSSGPDAEFHFGAPAPQAIVDRVRAIDESKVQFPGQSDAPPLGFHGDSPITFPLWIAGRWRLAAVGSDGVGWRTDEYTDFAVYDFKAGRIAPLAGIAVKRVLTGLTSAKVGTPDKGEN